MTEATEDGLWAMARAMYQHEWQGQKPPLNEWRESKKHWYGFALVAHAALLEAEEEAARQK